MKTNSTFEHLQQFVDNDLHFTSPNAQEELKTILIKLQDLQLQKQETVVVAFGEQLARAIATGNDPVNIDTTSGIIEIKEFHSKNEADAYKQGLADTHGWNDSYVLDMDDEKKYSSIIGS